MTKSNRKTEKKVVNIMLQKFARNYRERYEVWFQQFLKGDFGAMKIVRDELDHLAKTAVEYKLCSKAYFDVVDNNMWKEMTVRYCDELAEVID